MSLQIGPSTSKVDYLVIGSGFGGSVMAATLAKAGKNVCLFERGKAYPPGSFPRTPHEFGKNFWDPSAGLHGMFNIWSFDHLDAIVSSGLGGGSLIYANVMLRKDRSWFVQKVPGEHEEESWSFSREELDPHYRAVELLLDVQTVPPELHETHSPKTSLFLEASQQRAQLAPLAVKFRDEQGNPGVGAPIPRPAYGNIFGPVHRRTCRMIGECDVGCNDGAKNSMDHTFLSMAVNAGATVCIRTEVRDIKRLNDDQSGHLFEVGYVVHPEDAEGRPRQTDPPLASIKAKRVILAAGSLGSTFLMLSNAENLGFDSVDPRPIGERFSGNGDILGFAVPKSNYQDLEPTKGPVITAYQRFESDTDSSRDSNPATIRMYLEDGGFPGFLTWMFKALDFPGVAGRLFGEGLTYWKELVNGSRHSNTSEEVSRIFGGSPTIARALPLLGMGSDTPDGRLTFNPGKGRNLECTWNMASSRFHFEEMRRQMDRLIGRMGAKFVINPMDKIDRVITVHPLGGCPADTSKFDGVVDSFGRVHGVPGLWITDGSVMPGPVGANPSLTIAAFAHRAAFTLLHEESGTPSAAERFSPTT